MKTYSLLEEATFYAKKVARETGKVQFVYCPRVEKYGELPYLVMGTGEIIINREDYGYFGSFSKGWDNGKYIGE